MKAAARKKKPVRTGCQCVTPNPPTPEQELKWAQEARHFAEGKASAYRDAIDLFTRSATFPPTDAPSPR